MVDYNLEASNISLSPSNNSIHNLLAFQTLRHNIQLLMSHSFKYWSSKWSNFEQQWLISRYVPSPNSTPQQCPTRIPIVITFILQLPLDVSHQNLSIPFSPWHIPVSTARIHIRSILVLHPKNLMNFFSG